MSPHFTTTYSDICEERFIYTLNSYLSKEINATFYSISVEDINNNTKSNVNDITTVEKYAKKLYNIIKENLVQPCHLHDVVYNFICSIVEE